MDLTFAEISTFIFVSHGNLKAIMINWNGSVCSGVQHDKHWLSFHGTGEKQFLNRCQKTGSICVIK